MTNTATYQHLADFVLVLHTLFVGFVVLGLPLIFIGALRDWGWVRNFWFRLSHLLAIGVVVAQAWIGVICPLTNVESLLRQRAGANIYTESFIQHWLHKLIYFEAPMWIFTLTYTLFGLLVLLSWQFVPPRRRRSGDEPQ